MKSNQILVCDDGGKPEQLLYQLRTLQIKLNHNTFHKIIIFDERRKPDQKTEVRGKKSLGEENQQAHPKHSVEFEIEPEPH